MNKPLNYRVSEQVKKDFEEYCKCNNLITNKTLEKIIKDWLQKKTP